MIRSAGLLRSYVQVLKRLTGAVSVTLFVPASPRFSNRYFKAVLVHEGDQPPPELADLAAAEAFHQSTVAGLLGGRKGEEPLWADQITSCAPDCTLVSVPTVEALLVDPETRTKRAKGRRRGDNKRALSQRPVAAWVGLRSENGPIPLSAALEPMSHQPTSTQGLLGTYLWLLALGGALAWHTRQVAEVLDDPVTGLPGLVEFQAGLRRALVAAREESRPLSLLLMNPDEFPKINEQFGRDTGDRVIQEIAQRFRACHREDDLVARYGSAIFVSVLFDANESGGRVVAQKVLARLNQVGFLEGTVKTGISVGVATFDPRREAGLESLDLQQRVEQALNSAKEAGGGRFCEWSPETPQPKVGSVGRLSGIFTGSITKDYRNMLLLSETLSTVAASSDFSDLTTQVVENLSFTLKPDWVGLFTCEDGHSPDLVNGLARPTAGVDAARQAPVLDRDPHLAAVFEEARQLGKAMQTDLPALAGSPGGVAYVVPLIVADACLGYLYLEGRSEVLALDAYDLVFLQALAAQLGVALDRARLAEQEKRWQAQERQRLQRELDELRQALLQGKLVYRSHEMEAVLARVRQVAPTDATVLITGESGTGKELIARTLHRLSPRRSRPLVVVDCGALPATLMESELFGHEKGAYTGAQGRKIGRLVEADGGTVLLDEIGELPLDLQSKLLRFVQEKELTPVGGNQHRTVNVRVIAATNRDLASEVKARRFRQDLYYRLNVVHLEVPPLRRRPDDVLFLAHHFLQSYSVSYEKGLRRLTPQAEALLGRYPFPGNVRELQNMIMQAVILSRAPDIGAAELGLPQDLPGPAAVPWPGGRSAPSAEPPGGDGAGLGEDFHPGPYSSTLLTDPPLDSLLQGLRTTLGQQIAGVTLQGKRLLVPLGKWLGDDLILAADAAARGVAIRAAALVGIPESTFRRRLERVNAKGGPGPSRAAGWDGIRRLLDHLVRANELRGLDLLARSQEILLEELLTLAPEDPRTAAALLGVTVPTFRRRVAGLESKQT